MDGSQLSDEACERLIGGCLAVDEDHLAPVGWFLEDLQTLYVKPPTRAARSLHPSAVARPASSDIFWPSESGRACRPGRGWWYPSAEPTKDDGI